MKRRVLSFLAGAAAALALTALTATALAASGQVQFNFAGVALNGETKIAAGSDITAPNGQQVPGSILYVDEAGGKTNYLPIRTISELLGVEVGYDSASRTVLLGEQTVPSAASAGSYWHKETDEDGITYAATKNGDHDRSVQPGLYVAGDVRTKTLRQVVTAVSDGANAATTAAEYLRDINGYKQNI